MKKRKICVIITTRGNYAKMRSVMDAIQARDDLQLQLILGGGAVLPRYGLKLEALENGSFHVDRRIHFVVEGENPVAMAKSAGMAVLDFTTAFENLQPDFVVVIADRFECLSIAMAASYMNIPLAHVEGGEVSGSIDESVRHAITKLSHVHFPATENAGKRIERMGEDPAMIFPVGNTSLDVIAGLNLNDLGQVMELQRRTGVGPVVDIEKEPYLLVLQHPVTTEYEENLAHINETIAALEELRRPTIWIWPNIDAGSDGISKGIRVFRENKGPDYIHFFKSLPIENYAQLLSNATCIVGNSSSGIREAAFLGVPSVCVGSRQTGRERAENVIDVGYDRNKIKEAVEAQLAHGRYESSRLYGKGDAGEKIVDILAKIEVKRQKRIMY